MKLTLITATAVEKLKAAAKLHRDHTGAPLSTALNVVAVQAGYAHWKQVTEGAARSAEIAKRLLPATHRGSKTWVRAKGSLQPRQVQTVAELCEALGGVQPVFIRRPCPGASLANPCFCQLDQFATATQAGVALDVGDKYDWWNYLFDANEPALMHPGWKMRSNLGIATWDPYPNEHLATRGDDGNVSNDDKSRALNPNNSAYKSVTDNRSVQLNPNSARFQPPHLNG